MSSVPSIKVLLVGDSGVGKTCISKRYTCDGEFSDYEESTSGAEYRAKIVDLPNMNSQVIMDIWDTAGQEKYRALTKVFYNDASIVILVFDITRKQSFDNIKNFWIKEIKNNAPKDIIFGLAGNKSDIILEEECINQDEVNKFAKDIKALYKSTSAKDNTGISELFEGVGIMYFEKCIDSYTSSQNKNSILLDDSSKKDKKKCC